MHSPPVCNQSISHLQVCHHQKNQVSTNQDSGINRFSESRHNPKVLSHFACNISTSHLQVFHNQYNQVSMNQESGLLNQDLTLKFSLIFRVISPRFTAPGPTGHQIQ